MSTNSKVRISVELPPQLAERLKEICADSDLTLTDVLRRAVALVDIAYDAKVRSQRLGILNKDRELVTEITNVF